MRDTWSCDFSIYQLISIYWGFPGGSDGKEFACNEGDLGLIREWERSSREENGYTSILAWRIPWTEDPVELQCMGLQRVGQN